MYGKHRRTLRCFGHDFWASAHYLLQVAICLFWCGVASAEFDSTDSTNLRNCRRLLSALVNGDPDTVSITTGNIYDRFSDVWEVLRYADFPGMKDDLDSISTYTENSYYRLVNIESSVSSASRTLSQISDKLDNLNFSVSVSNTPFDTGVLVEAISNAIAHIPFASVSVTNFLTSSGDVDMGIVTNLWLSLNYPYDIFHERAWTLYPSFYDLYLHYSESTGIEGPAQARFAQFLSRSSFGLVMALLDSGLISESSIPPARNPWKYASDYWFGSDSSFKYSIFDAYNTLGLGVLTNQAASLLSVARSNTNLLTQIYSILGNSQYGVHAIAEAVSSASDSLETSGQADLDHSVRYDLPQWEPTYSREVDSNTNVFEFDDAMAGMMQSMLGDTTNQTGSLASNIGNIQSGGDLSLAFDFSGFNLGSSLQNFAPWSVSTSFAGLEEFKDFFKTLSRYMFYILDLCLVIIGCRRIQHAIIGDVGIL